MELTFKNCYNCKHFRKETNAFDKDIYYCERRSFAPKEESFMLKKLSEESYRAKSKVCFTVKKPDFWWQK